MIFTQDLSGEMASQLLVNRLRDDVVEIVDTVLTLNEVCSCLMCNCIVHCNAVVYYEDSHKITKHIEGSLN